MLSARQRLPEQPTPTMKRLEQRVADQLRAGEIADRPASVARELLDNALDAGATRIAVSITGGGLREVTVADNGCGIAAGDVAMAFERYTTSKAGGAAYPGSGTLGFRGEALAAIAAVAQVICVTRATGADEAVELRVAGGEVQSTAIAAREYGTTVSVRNLFYNTPERRAFLRSDLAETAELAAVVGQYAVAHPGVHVTFAVDGRKRFAAGGAGSLRATMADLYGDDVACALLTVTAEAVQPADEENAAEGPDWVRIAGLISPPDLGRESRAYIFISAKGRPIRPDRHFSAILSEAYQTLLPHDRYPIVALHIEAPAWAVDVAGQPGKTRVRFRDPAFVGRQIGIALHAALLEAAGPRWQRRGPPTPARGAAAHHGVWPFERPESEQAPASPADDQLQDRAVGAGTLDLTLLHPIGQLHQRYIMAESHTGLVLIDQQAAGARIRYEQIRTQLLAGGVPGEALEMARDVVVPPAAHALLLAHAEPLSHWGFSFEDCGQSLRVLATPRLRLDRLGATLLDVADHLSQRALRAPEEIQEALVTTLAAASAIGEEPLRPEQMRALLDQLARCKQPWTCPRGRPVVRVERIQHIEALFGYA